MVLFDLISSKKQADEHSVASGSTLSTSIYSGTAKVEANYDTDPTVLYSLIQRRKWDDAVKRIKSYPAEAHTWVFRMEKNNKNKIRWRILPIHVALVFKADIAVIEALVSAYPQGVRQIDDQGMVPLHLAFRNNASELIVNILISQFPDAVHYKDRKGRTPTDLISTNDKKNFSMRHFLSTIIKEREEVMVEIEDENLELQNKLTTAKTNIERLERLYEGTRSSRISSEGREDNCNGASDEEIERITYFYEQKIDELQSTLTEERDDSRRKIRGIVEEHEELKTILASKDAQHQKALDELTAKINDLSKRNETGLIKAQNLESEMNVLLPEMDTISQENQTNKDRIEKFISVIIKLQPDSNKDCFDKCENIDQKVDKAVSILEGLPSYDENESEREAHAAKVDENEKLKAEVERVLSESNDHQKKMETWRQAALEQDDKNEALKEEVEGLKEENGKLKKSLEETTQSSTDVSELMEEKKLLTEKLSEALRENVLNTETVEKQSTIIDQLTKDVEEARKEAQDSLQQSAENTSNTGNKSVESILDVSQSQIEEIMKVNKSFQDGALKSAERYKMLKDLYDNTAKKLKTANELANILQGDVDVSKKKLHEAEMKYQDMKAEFENERRELIAECDEEHNQRMKDNEEARATILELEQALEAEELEKNKLMRELESIEEYLMAKEGEHKSHKKIISDMKFETESLQRQIGDSEREKKKLQQKVVVVERERSDFLKQKVKMEKERFELDRKIRCMESHQTTMHQKYNATEKERSSLLRAKLDLEADIDVLEQELIEEKKKQDKLLNEIKSLEDSIETNIREHENEKMKQARVIQNLTKLNESLEKNLSEEKAKTGTHIGQIERERSELQQELKIVLDKLEEKDNRIESLEDELKGEKGTFAALESELGNLKVAIVRQFGATEQEKDELEQELRKEKKELTDMNDSLEKKLAEEKTKNYAYIMQIETERKELQKELTIVLDELDDKVTMIQNLEDELVEEKDAFAALDSELVNLRDAMIRNDKFQKVDIEKLHNKIEGLENRLSKMKSHHKMEVEKFEKCLREEEKLRKSLSLEVRNIERTAAEEAKRHEKKIEGYEELVDALENQKKELQNIVNLLEHQLKKP